MSVCAPPVDSYLCQGSWWAGQLFLLSHAHPVTRSPHPKSSSLSQYWHGIWGKLPFKYPSQSYTCEHVNMETLGICICPIHGTRGEANFSDRLGQGQQLSLGTGLEEVFLSPICSVLASGLGDIGELSLHLNDNFLYFLGLLFL